MTGEAELALIVSRTRKNLSYEEAKTAMWWPICALTPTGCGGVTPAGNRSKADPSALNGRTVQQVPNPPSTATPPAIELLTPDGQSVRDRKEIILAGPSSLHLVAVSPPDRVEYFAKDQRGVPPWRGEFLLGTVKGNERFEWKVAPPEQVEVYAVAYYGDRKERSESVIFRYPLPEQEKCPDAHFPVFPASAHGQVSLVVDSTLKVVTIVTPGGSLDFSIAVDPATCQDPQVKHWLSQANLKAGG